MTYAARTVQTSMQVDKELHAFAKTHNINMSAVLRRGLTQLKWMVDAYQGFGMAGYVPPVPDEVKRNRLKWEKVN